MKLILSLALLTLAAAGWLGLTSSDAKPAAAATQCHATVECTSRGTCVITCYDEDGEVCCVQEIPCPADCADRSSCSR